MMSARFPTCLALGLAVLGAGCTATPDSSKSLAETAGFTTRVGDPKPFVLETRRADADYLPVGVTVARPAPKKTAADFKAIEQSLDAKKGSNESAGTQARVLGSTPPPKPPPVPPPL
jgi:hypothetical protein